jgi:hypothetical protein
VLKHKIWIPIVLCALVATVAILVVQKKSSAGKLLRVEGTLTSLDVATRQAALEVINPRDGQLLEIYGYVPPGCPIHLNAQPVTLEKLTAGDRVVVHATWDRKRKKATAASVEAMRPARPASAPATTPAG